MEHQRGCGLSGCCPPVKVSQEDIERILRLTGGAFEDYFEEIGGDVWTKNGDPITIHVADPNDPEDMDLIARPCIFMRPDGLCSLHYRFGKEAKPEEQCQNHECECEGCNLCVPPES